MAGGGGSEYGASLAISDSSGASNSGSTSLTGGGGTKYQIVTGGGLSGLTPQQIIPIVVGLVALAVLALVFFSRR